MDQKQGPDLLKPPFAYHPVDAVLRPDDLKYKNELVLDHMRRKLRAFFPSRERHFHALIPKTRTLLEKFVKNVYPWTLLDLEAHLDFTDSEGSVHYYSDFHFQIYDFLMLSDEDRMEVLEGRPAKNGYFELANRLTRDQIQKKFEEKIREDKAILFGNGNVHKKNVAKRLNFLLLENRWTRSQFTYYVIDKAEENGAKVADIIDNEEAENNPAYRDLYFKILGWLRKDEGVRYDLMHNVPEPDLESGEPSCKKPRRGSLDEQIRELIANYFMEVLVKACDTQTAEFRRYMKWLANDHLERLTEELGLLGEEDKDKANRLKRLQVNTRSVLTFLSSGAQLNSENRAKILDIVLMDGSKTDHSQVARCIRFVLKMQRYEEDLFAERVLKCSKPLFQRFLNEPSRDQMTAASRPIFYEIRHYLLYLDPKFAWEPVLTDYVYRRVHLEFLHRHSGELLKHQGFRAGLKALAEQQLEILRRDILLRRVLNLTAESYEKPDEILQVTEDLLKFLTAKFEKRMEDQVKFTWPIRQRITTLAFMDGAKYSNFFSIAECIRHLFPSPTLRSQFVENVLECPLEDLDDFIDSPNRFLERADAPLIIVRIIEYITMNCQDREEAMNGEKKNLTRKPLAGENRNQDPKSFDYMFTIYRMALTQNYWWLFS